MTTSSGGARVPRRIAVSAMTLLLVLVGLLTTSAQVGAGSAHAAADPLFLITPTAFDFGAQPLGSPSPQQVVTITNITNAPIVMSGAGGGAGIFGGSQDCQGLTIAAGGSCHMYYQFTPNALGAVTGSTGGNWNGQTFSFSFKGIGVPRFRISPTSFDFGGVQFGSTSPQQRVTITNLGSTSIVMSGAGGGAGIFGGSQDCQGLTIAAGGSCHMFYQFTPNAVGPATGSTGGNWNGQTFSFSFKGVGLGTVAGTEEFVPVSSERLLHTKSPQVGYHGSRPAAGATVAVQVAGAGTAAVPSNARAVALDVTAAASRAGSVWVYACGTARPKDPALRVDKKSTATALNVPALGGGKVCLHTSTSANLTATIVGWYPATTSFQPVAPARLLHTSAPKVGYHGHQPKDNATVRLKVAGHAGVPSGASGVLLNVTVSGAKRLDPVTVYACGTSRPKDASIRVAKGDTISGLTISRLGANGRVCLFTRRSANLTADVAGWYPSNTPVHVVTPERLLHNAKAGSGQVVQLQVTGVGHTAMPSTTSAVLLSVTVTHVTRAASVTVYGCEVPRPVDATIHIAKGGTATSLTVPQLGAGGKVCLFANRSAHVTADVLGWYPG